MILSLFAEQSVAIVIASGIALNFALGVVIFLKLRANHGDQHGHTVASSNEDDLADDKPNTSDRDAANTELSRLKEEVAFLQTQVKHGFEIVTHEFNQIFDREQSWLASPYPRVFRVGSGPQLHVILEKVGLQLKGRIAFYPLCEHANCAGINKNDDQQQEYIFENGYTTITPRFIGSLAKVSWIAFGVHLTGLPIPSPLGLISPHLMKILKEIPKHLMPELEVSKNLLEHLEPEAFAALLEKLTKHLKIEHNKFLHPHETAQWKAVKHQLEDELDSQLAGRIAAVLEPGGSGHLFMGKLMEAQDATKRNRVPHGGLVRVLKDEKCSNGQKAIRSKYLWVCPTCRSTVWPDFNLTVAPAPNP